MPISWPTSFAARSTCSVRKAALALSRQTLLDKVTLV